MYDFFDTIKTPEEIAQFRAATERQLSDANILNNRLSTTANMTKNLNPMANLGIMLGTLGGMWGAQRLNDIWQKKASGLNASPTPSPNYQFIKPSLERQYPDWRAPNYPNVLNVQSDFYKPFLANMQRNFLTPYNPNR